MIPDSVPALASHIQAVGLLLHAHGPDMCSFGLLHKLFVGFRPLLVPSLPSDLSGVWLLSLDIDNAGVTKPPAYIFSIATMD